MARAREIKVEAKRPRGQEGEEQRARRGGRTKKGQQSRLGRKGGENLGETRAKGGKDARGQKKELAGPGEGGCQETEGGQREGRGADRRTLGESLCLEGMCFHQLWGKAAQTVSASVPMTSQVSS